MRCMKTIESFDLKQIMAAFVDFDNCEEIMRGVAKEDRFWPVVSFWGMVFFGVLSLWLGYLQLTAPTPPTERPAVTSPTQ